MRDSNQLDIKNNEINNRIDMMKPQYYIKDLINSMSENHIRNCTSIHSLNERIRRIEGFTLLAGQPKTGKSTLAQQIAEDYASNKLNVLYYDFEMGGKRFFRRSFQRKTGVNYDIEIEKNDNTVMFKQIIEYEKWYYQKFQQFFYRPSNSLDELRPNTSFIPDDIKTIREMTKINPTVLFIDSLQKLPVANINDRRTSIDIWLRFFEKLIAKMNIAIWVICELSREGRYKESGDIEYTVDNAINLHYPNNDSAKNQPDSLKLTLKYSRDYDSGEICELNRQRPNWSFVEKTKFNYDGLSYQYQDNDEEEGI